MVSVLVTGAEGFVGTALCRALVAEGHSVVRHSRREGNITEPATFDRVGRVDQVFHLASRTFVPDSWRDPLEFHRTNVLGTINVLNFCRVHQSRLTYVSACAVYGVPERLPVSENCVPRPNNPYALSKHLAEEVCAFYARHHGVRTTVVRPFNVFGPNQKKEFLIPMILGQMRERKAIRVRDLEPRRDYLYVGDLAEALVKTMGAPDGYNVINIGSGGSLSVLELVGLLQSVAGTGLPVFSDSDVRINEIDDIYADIGRARSLLGWSPRHTVRQGLEQMLFQEQDA